MQNTRLRRIDESGTFKWPWHTALGLIVIEGAAGGGGGGGGAFCMEGLNLFGGGGGGGGAGGGATTVKFRSSIYRASGGNGGGGGGGGGIVNSEPVRGKDGTGSLFGKGGDGGLGAAVSPSPNRIVSNGGDGGKGFSGENIILEIFDLNFEETFEIDVGDGGNGGEGGGGYRKGSDGFLGNSGSVLFVPILDDQGDA